MFGAERASRISPTRSTVQRDMVFTTHNDAPIVPPNMLRLLWATANRVTRSGQTLGPEQRISVYQALMSITMHAAYQMFEEDSKGSITEGKWADLVVLSANPLQVDAKDLQDIEVRATYSRGLPIYHQ
ncbi:MAG: amidohydrolase family protein [Gammaproteobacteria bacterium]|nr:amidohydrolase family protein [Gammaproteobacteria bacterium]